MPFIIYRYNQFVGQLLIQAFNELNDEMQEEEEIVTYGISISGNLFRFASLNCSVAYLRSFHSQEIILKKKPKLLLSKPLNLLQKETRGMASGVLFGRAK